MRLALHFTPHGCESLAEKKTYEPMVTGRSEVGSRVHYALKLRWNGAQEPQLSSLGVAKLRHAGEEIKPV